MSQDEIGRRVDAFQQAARAAGVKLTHQRLEVFRALAGSEEHPSAESLLRSVRPRLPTVSLDTVYRTLWLLHDLGLVSTLGPRRESARFDANLAPHHHYVCVRCGMARDFESEELAELRIPATVAALGSIDATRVEVRGVCARCASGSDEQRARKGIDP